MRAKGQSVSSKTNKPKTDKKGSIMNTKSMTTDALRQFFVFMGWRFVRKAGVGLVLGAAALFSSFLAVPASAQDTFNIGNYTDFYNVFSTVTSNSLTINLTAQITVNNDNLNNISPRSSSITIQSANGNTVTLTGSGKPGIMLDSTYDGTITFRNISFSGFSSQFSGAALNLFSGGNTNTVILQGSIIFVSNSLPNTGTAQGGALYQWKNYINIQPGATVTFSGNTSNASGGGAYGNAEGVLTSSAARIDFSNNLTKNDKDGLGGAMRVSASEINLAWSTITFIGNKAKQGGAIYSQLGSAVGFNFSYSSVTFYQNTVYSATDGTNRGGAIYATMGTNINFIGSQVYFSSNSNNTSGSVATSSGGAIFVGDGAMITFSSSTVRFDGNIAVFNANITAGGAIYTDRGFVRFEDSDITFANNRAYTKGAGMYITEGNGVEVVRSKLSFVGGNLTLLSPTTWNTGDLIFINYGRFRVTEGELAIVNTTIPSSHTLLWVEKGSVLEVIKGTWTSANNTYADGFSMTLGGDGTFLFQESSLVIGSVNSSVVGAWINMKGGNPEIIFDRSTVLISSNVATQAGAGIHSTSALGRLIFRNGSYVIFSSNSAGTINNTDVSNGGGGIAVNNGTAQPGFFLAVYQSTFIAISNSARSGRGGFYEERAGFHHLIWADSYVEFTSNVARLGGGVFGLVDNTNLTISFINSQTIFQGNYSGLALGNAPAPTESRGGAIYIGVTNTLSSITVRGGSITFNQNRVYSVGSDVFQSSGAGGAVYLGTGTMSFENASVVFSSNIAPLWGAGAIVVGNAQMKFINANTSFTYNVVGGYGNPLLSYGGAGLALVSDQPTSGIVYASFSGGRVEFLMNRQSSASTTKLASDTGGAAILLLNPSDTANSPLNFSSLELYFTSNTAYAAGGAVYVGPAKIKWDSLTGTYGANFTISDSTGAFSYNSALSNSAGGAIYLAGRSFLNIVRSSLTFAGNLATVHGGAIFMDTNSSATISGSFVMFSSNSLNNINQINTYSIGGAGIYMNGGTADLPTLLNIINSSVVFKGNWEVREGGDGSIYTHAAGAGMTVLGRSSIAVVGSYLSFEGNKSINTNSGSRGGDTYASALFLFGGDGNISFSAIGSTVVFDKNITRAGINAAGVEAASYGGAIYFNSDDAKIVIKNSNLLFSNNLANIGGGIFANSGQVYLIDNSMVQFIGNRADGIESAPNGGGAIRVGGSGKWAYIYVQNNDFVLFASNTARTVGGAIALAGNPGTMTFQNKVGQTIKFEYNYMNSNGLGNGTANDIYVDGGGILNSRFLNIANNGDLSNLSGIYVVNKAVINKSGSGMWTLSGWNVLSDLGGPIDLQGPMIVQYATFTWFIGEDAAKLRPQVGSSLYFINSSVTFANATQPYYENGGAILITASDGILSIKNSKVLFYNNNNDNIISSAAGGNNGGAVFMQIPSNGSFDVVVEDSELSFINNTTLQGAGGFYLRGDANSTTRFSNSTITFIANKATANGVVGAGGGMLVANAGTIFQVENSVVFFTSNVANGINISITPGGGGGGGLYIHGDNDLKVIFSGSYINFTSNTALGIGGGIRFMNGSLMTNMLTISHSTAVFLYNTAFSSGGAISAEANLTINNSNIIFDSNWAQHGGAIYARGNVSFIDSNILFSSNTASRTQYVDGAGSAGAMFVDNGGKVTFSGGIVNFILNRGWWNSGIESGTGALFIYTGGSLTVSNGATVIFTSNAVDNFSASNSRGGALKIYNGGTINVTNSTLSFFYNKAPGSGGATFISGDGTGGGPDAHFRAENAYLYFESNISAGDAGGGAFGIGGAGRVGVINSTFIAKNNTAAVSGGAIYHSQTYSGLQSSISFYSSLVVFESNKAGVGGAINLKRYLGRNGYALQLYKDSTVKFIGNKADTFGGAIQFGGDADTEGGVVIFFEDSVVEFTSNSAGTSGGAIAIIGGADFGDSRITFTRSTTVFTDNELTGSNRHGLSIYINNNSSVNFYQSDTNFELHEYSYRETTVLDTANNGQINFIGGIVRFSSNTSSGNGGLWWSENLTSTPNNGIVFIAVDIVARLNYAEGAGGFFYTTNEVTNTNYTVNIGGNSIASNLLFRRGTDISSNVSASDGGAIL